MPRLRASFIPFVAGVVALGAAGATPAVGQALRVAGDARPILPEGFAHAVYAPSGAHLAFTTPSYEGLWVRDEATGRVRQLSDAPSAGFGFAWSPDGDALAVRAARFDATGGREDALLVIGVDGAARTVADFAPGVSATPRWSVDGTEILLARRSGAVERLPSGRAPAVRPALTPRGAAALSLGDGASLLTDGASRPAALPDDVPVLAAVASPTGDRTVVHLMGRGLWLVTAAGDVRPLGEGQSPVWSPDGRYIAFAVTEDDGYAITGADLYVVRADGTERQAITATPDVYELHPTWAPDGRALLYDDLAATRVMRLPLTDRR